MGRSDSSQLRDLVGQAVTVVAGCKVDAAGRDLGNIRDSSMPRCVLTDVFNAQYND